MKTIRLLLGIAMTLCVGTISSQAHGCGFGFSFGFPCLSFGIGFGLGSACSYPAYGCHYAYSGYYPGYYPASPYAYDPPANQVASVTPPAVSMPVAPIDPPAPVWVPSTLGAGHWVQEPQPYCYVPAASVNNSTLAVAHETLTTSQSPGAVRLYIVNR
jgi:hypothetical protein